MQSQTPIALFLLSTVLLATNRDEVAAQNASETGANRSVRITQMMSPTFKVSPLVHSFEGRRGQTIPFTFSVESFGRAARVRVRAVPLMQQITGVILPGKGTLVDNIITLDSPDTFELGVGENMTISGEVQVPLVDTSFFSCGLLVTDLGMNDLGDTSPQDGESRVQVRFMTQYLCRCDIRIPSGRQADVSRVVLNPVRIVPHRGWPMIHVYAHNPTDNALEFELRCRFAAAGDVKRSRAFGLVMPVRSNLDSKERFSARILPGATVRLESVIPQSVVDGDYMLQTELIANRRTIDKSNRPFRLQDTHFPAQQVQIAELRSGIALEPTQIELSMLEGGSKLQTVQLTNRTNRTTSVMLRAINEDGTSMKAINVRPGQIRIAGKGTRRVSVTAHPSAYRGRTSYCRLEAVVDGVRDEAAWPVTVAVVGKNPMTANVTPGPMRIDTTAAGQYVVVPLENSGGVHLPVSGQILVIAENGMRHELLAGFGKWLLPGEQTNLRFRLPSDLAEGEYQMMTDIEFGLRLAAMQRTDPVTFPIRVAREPGGRKQR